MKKLFLAIYVICFCWAVPTEAQTRFALGAEFIYPTSVLGDVAGGGFGLNATIVRALNEKMYFLGDIGFNAYGGVTVGTVEIQWYGVPVAAGIRFFASEQFFLQGKGGITYKTGEAEEKTSGLKTDENETGWLLSPGIGVQFNKFGALAEYNISNDSWQWFGLRAFYQFGGK